MTTASFFRAAARSAALLAVVPVLLGSPASLSAQTIDGVLLDSATSQPIPSTYVVLLDSANREIVRAPTGPEGGFRFFPPRPGSYRVDLAHVGWDADPSSAFQVATGEPTPVEYRVVREPVDLSAVVESSSCGPSSRVQPAWAEARKGLGATAWTAGARRHVMRVRLFQRDLGRDAHTVLSEEDSTSTDAPGLPFANQEPLEVIESGFATEEDDGRLTYYMPDPATLSTPEFEDTHCFSIERANGRLGVHFAPTDGQERGVQGTLWLDASSGELERLEFRYANDPSGADDDRVGGVIAFRRLTRIDWVVTRWRLRMPDMVNGDSTNPAALVGFREVGGHLLQVTDSTDTPLYADRATAVLTGSVFDGIREQPLANAVVTLAGTEHWTTTDPRGQFVIAGHLVGTYRLAFGHPRIDSLGYRMAPRMIDLDRQTPIRVDLAIPSFDSIVGQRCDGASLGTGGRLLHGVVRDGSGRPVSGALVQVSRSIVPAALRQMMSDDLDLLAITDSLGTYALCGIQVGRSIMVNAAIEGESSDMVAVEFDQDGVRLNQQALTLSRPVARLDLHLAPHADRDTEISGLVTNAGSGEPIDGALVQVDGTGFTARTDASGRFGLRGVPTGTVNLSVRRVGFRSVHRALVVRQARPVSLGADSLAMSPIDETATELDPIEVEADPYARKLSGFEDRRAMGIGSFVSRDEFEKWNPTVATDVLRRMHGIRIVPNAAYGVGGDTRRFVIRSSRDIGFRITKVEPIAAVRSVGSFNESGNTVVTECPMLVFMDRMFIGDSRDTDVDNVVSTTNLAAVEVFTASQVPPQFRLQGSTCGVVAFWTR